MTALPLLALLLGCPKAPATAAAPEPPQPIQAEPAREPPLPPPAPVELGFHWPNGSACLMATRRTETVSSGATVVSNLTGVGSGVVVAMRQDDGSWGISLEDRNGTTRHTPLEAELLTELEEIQLEVQPTLILARDGAAVTEVRGLDGVLDASRGTLEGLAKAYNKEVEALWVEQLPQILGPEVLRAGWSASWADGWGFAYGRTWTAGETVELESSTGARFTATYDDVVPCKFNEDEPLCVRIRIAWPEAPVDSPDARLRAQLPAGAERTAEAASRTGVRTGELVIEAGSGLPWRWTTTEDEVHRYASGETQHELLVRRKQDVSCDWRVAE